MLNSKVYRLFLTLDGKQHKKLELFLKSFSGNKAEDSQKLFSYFMKEKKQTPSKNSSFNFVFPDQVYNDQKLRLVQSDLLKMVESYLVFEIIHDEEYAILSEMILLEFYRKNKLGRLYTAQFNKLKKQWNKSGKWDTEKLSHNFKLEIEQYQSDSIEKRKEKLNIEDISHSIDLYYFAQKLKFACLASAHQSVYSHTYHLQHIPWVLEQVVACDYYEHPLIGAYYYAYQMINNPQDEFLFQQYTDFIKNKEPLLEADELQTLFFFAINYCIRRLNGGEKEYGVLGLEMYERALNNNTLLIDGYLSRFTYRNIAMMAIRSEQFDWAEKFSHDHVELLRKDDKDSAYHFNLALINYFKSNFEDALSHIQQADFKDHLIHLAAKTLQAKIYFELNATKALDSVLDSVDIYLTRNKILGYHKNNYKNIIKYFKRLSRHNPYDKEARQKLRDKISSEEILTEKNWLLEKLL